MRLYTLLVACLLSLPATCLATVQARDALKFEGQEGFIEQNPIGPLLTSRHLKFVMTSTANYSGYLASWAVRDGKLYLSDFTGRRERRFLFWTYTQDVGLKWLFPRSHGDVLADWYTGDIHLNLGAIKLSAIGGHVVATEVMVIFTVAKGQVLKTVRLPFPENLPIINKRNSEFFGRPFDISKEKW